MTATIQDALSCLRAAKLAFSEAQRPLLVDEVDQVIEETLRQIRWDDLIRQGAKSAERRILGPNRTPREGGIQ